MGRVRARDFKLVTLVTRQAVHLAVHFSWGYPRKRLPDAIGQKPVPTLCQKGANMANGRKRNKTLSLRLTESEKKKIYDNAKKARLTITEYITFLSNMTPIYVREDVKPVLAELKKIGNNLNQITVKINSGVFSSYNFKDVISEMRKIYEALDNIARK